MLRFVGLIFLVGVAASPVQAQESPNPAKATLYTRLGGYDGLARFVDTAFPRVARTPQLQKFFQGHSRDSQMRQRQLIIDALCRATGGPCAYLGRDLVTVHTGLGITDADWDVFIGVIEGTLRELDTPATPRTELLRVFERDLRRTVVVR